MTEFISIAASFPTVIFTVGLGISALYWIAALLGAVDLEVFDAADGVLDGAIDGALEGALDGAMDAGAEALGDAAAEGAAEGLEGAVEGTGGLLFGLASLLRIGKVPVTVTLSLFTLWGWVVGFLMTWLFRHPLDGVAAPLTYSLIAMGGAVLGAFGLTNATSRPFEPLFQTHEVRGNRALIGEVAEIETGRVDARFGQARIVLGGDELHVQVRCDHPDNKLGRGDRALVVHFDQQREAFVVEPLATHGDS